MRPVIVAALAFVLLMGGGCKRASTYSQDTPDDVLKSAVAMVKNNETRRLTELVYADSPEMRALLRRLGLLMQDMQELSKASAQRWPTEFQKLQDDAAAAAADPKNKGLIAQFMAAGMGGSSGPPRAPNADEVRAAFSAFLADPYGWLDRGASRLTTSKVADDIAVVLLDGQPVIPVIGLTMRKDGERWYVVLPTSMPPLSGYMPRTRQQWSILGSVLTVLDNAAKASTDDVRAGKVADIKNLTDKYQDKVLIPLVMAIGPYAKELDVLQRTDRRMAALRNRVDGWARKRREGNPETGAISPKVLETVPKLAYPRIEAAVRANKGQKFAEMTDLELEDTLAGWWREAGLNLKPDGDLTPAAADAAVAAWQAEQARVAVAKAKEARGRPAKK